MTSSDLVALVARLRNGAATYIGYGETPNPVWLDAAAAIEQLQAELDVATMALKLKPRPYADADLLIEERDAARGIAHGLHEGLELMSVERDALRAELDLRNKGDPVKRLHNLCDALMKQANESPFTKEQWDQLDAENVSLRAELEACKEDVSELRALDNEAQHGADALRAERDHLQNGFNAAVATVEGLRAELEAIRDKLVSTELLESLAAVEHNRWAGWMRYQETASAERRADWPRKAALAYTQLTHDEQESDREEVRTTLAVIEDSLNAAVRAARAQGEGER